MVANRESVNSSNWNDKILEAVFRAFVSKAVPRFNEIRNIGPSGAQVTAGLRYTWPLYLRDRGGTNEFWRKLKQGIFVGLARNEILESRHNGQLCRPETLYYIGTGFRLDGMPLVEDERSAQRHLSFLYDSGVLTILYDMGLKRMGINYFVHELKEIIVRVGNSYLESQSREWHSKLADVLRLYNPNRSSLSDLPLIPLRDGRWVTASHRHVFLEEDRSISTIPGGLDIHLVQAEACRDPRRKALFIWLGIRECDRGEVCRMIIERYSSPRLPTLVDAVDDAIYLFKTPRLSRITAVGRLLLVGGPPSLVFKNGHDLYVEEPNQTSIISRYAENPASTMPLLHPMYISKVRELGQESEFVSWICSNLGVSTKPRLVDRHRRLTPEFTFLKANAGKDLLLLLRDSWEFYASQLEHSDSVLKNALKEMNVVCTDEQLRPLSETILPREPLRAAAPNLPFIDIPDPDNTGWNKLAVFGVLTWKSSTLYLRELKALALLPVDNTTTRPAADAVYAGIQSSLSDPDIQIK